MKHALQTVLIILGAASIAADAPPLRFRRAIGTTSLSRDDLIAVELDADVMAETQDDFRDLRIRDSKNREVPFLLERVSTRPIYRQDERTGANVLSLKNTDENTIEIVARPAKVGFNPSWIEFESPLKDFEKAVSVWGSRADGTPRKLADSQPIFDYTRFMDVRSVRVHLAAADTPFSSYRIQVASVTDLQTSAIMHFSRTLKKGAPDAETMRSSLRRRDFRIDTLWFGRTGRREGSPTPTLTPRPVTLTQQTVNEQDQRTELIVTNPRLPLSGFRFDIESRNFNRQVTVQIEDARPAAAGWKTIATGTLSNLSFRSLRQGDTEIRFGETREPTLRILIQNQDSPPLKILSLVGLGPTYRTVFLGESGHQYHLAYGSDEASAPRYDETALRAIRSQRQVELVTRPLGEVVEAEGPDGFSIRRFLEHPATLGTAAVLAIAVLGLGIMQALKRVDLSDGTPPSDPNTPSQ